MPIRHISSFAFNMKVFLALLVSVAVLSQGHVSSAGFFKQTKTPITASKCGVCVNLMGQMIDQLLNIILNAGVVGGCSELCTKLPQQAEQEICDVLCSVLGIEEFIKLIEKADIDPIYYCEEIKFCPVMDNGDATITSFSIQPKSGPQGVFHVQLSYTSKNGTGTGEIILEVETVDHIPVDTNFLHELAVAGDYTTNFTLRAEPNPDCDPTEGPCEQWLPGNYTLKTAICNGECGSEHPHSAIYDQSTTTFTITES